MIRSLVLVVALFVSAPVIAAEKAVALYKTPNCTCCDAYAGYLRDNGFEVEVIPTHGLSGLKAEHGVPKQLAGCHTSLIGGYVFEGHIPVASVKRVLEDRPSITGISVPGMPTGSPGMTGDLREPLRVWTIPDGSGKAPAIHATYRQIPE